VSGQLHSLDALPPWKKPPVPAGKETGWAPELVWSLWSTKDSSALSRNRTLAVHPIAILIQLSRLLPVIHKTLTILLLFINITRSEVQCLQRTLLLAEPCSKISSLIISG
jgi:hypothetical protein